MPKYDGGGEAVKDADWLHRDGDVESSFSAPACLFITQILDSEAEMSDCNKRVHPAEVSSLKTHGYHFQVWRRKPGDADLCLDALSSAVPPIWKIYEPSGYSSTF